MILASIPLIIAVIAGVILFTNVDEVISESVEIDTSTLNFVTNTWAIDSHCNYYLAYAIEWNQPDPSQWYLDNFSKEREKLIDDFMSSTSDSVDLTYYYESLEKKTNPNLLGFPLLYHAQEMNDDPECYQIFLDKYPNRIK